MAESELIVTTKKELISIIRTEFDSLLSSRSQGSFDTSTEPKISQKKAAEYLGVTEQTIINWKKKSKIPFHQLPGTKPVHYYKSELKLACEQNPGLLRQNHK